MPITPEMLFSHTPQEKVVFLSHTVMVRQTQIVRAVLTEDWDEAERLIDLQIADLSRARKPN
jgi:hypothetical protein